MLRTRQVWPFQNDSKSYMFDEYAKQAKATWGTTDAYKEYEQKSKDWAKEDRSNIHWQMMDLLKTGFKEMPVLLFQKRR